METIYDNPVIIDCHYCEWGTCKSPIDSCNCYCEDEGYFSHTVVNSKEEAEKCLWFRFDNNFPKY